MRWKQFLTPVRSLSAEEAREYLDSRPRESVNLVDVRQPHEYERDHLPGAALIPLPELSDRQVELDRKKPTLVYCAVGGRSRLAAQLLAGRGFTDVINLKGGIEAWHGRKALGPVLGKDVVTLAGIPPDEILFVAYGMEVGLKELYATLASETTENSLSSLLKTLASYEEGHKSRLFSLYVDQTEEPLDRDSFSRKAESAHIEGGVTAEEIVASNRGALNSVQDVLNLAMMIEAQALDFYARCADQTRNKRAGKLFNRLSDEEKAHLKILGHHSGPESGENPAF